MTRNTIILDGLELLKAIARMEGNIVQHTVLLSCLIYYRDEQEEKEPTNHRFNIEQIIPIVDSILEQDDKVYIT